MVQKHIDELEREGIAPPPEVPMWYEMPVGILTQAASISVPTKETCGEAQSHNSPPSSEKAAS